MLTTSLAVEWLPLGIRLNSISPGYASEQTLGVPHELGPLAVYLLGAASAYVVGQSIITDGGYTAL